MKNVKGYNGYALSEGDIIRLGKVQLKIKEIKGLRKQKTIKPVIQSKSIYAGGIGGSNRIVEEIRKPLIVKTLETCEEPVTCRICLSDECTNENFMITPCNCAGSMG